MKTKIIALLALSALFLCSCSDTENSSQAEQTTAETTTTTTVNTVSDDTSATATAEDKCTIVMDTTSLHSGVDFTESEIIDLTSSFCDNVQKGYEPLEEFSLPMAKGKYLKISLVNSNEDICDISINSINDNYVQINGETYFTENNETKDFCENVKTFVSDKGY